MLVELVVAGLGAIDRAEIKLGPGCTALTGETGAGKTLLVAALGLLAGARADRGLIREGSTEAVVEGRFVLPRDHPAAALVAELGFDDGDGDPVELILTRSVGSSGSRARINGRLATTSVLAELGGFLIEIAGQNEHQRLGSPRSQRSLLDAYGGRRVVELAEKVEVAVREAAAAARELAELDASRRERERELDVLRYEVAEIEGAGIREGETEELKGSAARLEHAEELATASNQIGRMLTGERGVTESLVEARRSAEAAAALDPTFAEVAARLETLAVEADDIAQEVVRREIAPDPGALASARERLDQLAKLKRKYGDTEAEVLAYLERAQARLQELDSTDERVEELRATATEKQVAAMDLARLLSRERKRAAKQLAPAVEERLGGLALPGARFCVAREEKPLHEGGLEGIEFRFAADPGATPRPLGKVASGGELSRVALALHVLTGTGQVPTLVFDEVDAGVGGEAAQTVGRSLADLADQRAAQVLVVTHLPQVAAFADTQVRVTKSSQKGSVAVNVEPVHGTARVEELSRMLAGLPESERARKHDEELLEIAGRS